MTSAENIPALTIGRHLAAGLSGFRKGGLEGGYAAATEAFCRVAEVLGIEIPAKRLEVIRKVYAGEANAGAALYVMKTVAESGRLVCPELEFRIACAFDGSAGGIPRNVAEGRKWLLRAAEHDHPRAGYEMGKVMQHDDQPIEAYKWFSITCDPHAEASLDELKRELSDEDLLAGQDLVQAHRRQSETHPPIDNDKFARRAFAYAGRDCLYFLDRTMLEPSSTLERS